MKPKQPNIKQTDRKPTYLNKVLKYKPKDQRKPHQTVKKKDSKKSNPPAKVNFVVNPNKLRHQLTQVEKNSKFQKFQVQREEKQQEYKKKKFERNKTLTHKTKRGQPVMKGRMEMLLSKIQAQIANS